MVGPIIDSCVVLIPKEFQFLQKSVMHGTPFKDKDNYAALKYPGMSVTYRFLTVVAIPFCQR